MIVAVGGQKGSGKSTVGNYLVDEYGFNQVSFAAKIKKVICNTFEIPLEHLEELKDSDTAIVLLRSKDEPDIGMTFRQFMQRLQNEGMKSAYGNMFHTNQLLPSNFDHAGFLFVVTDMRYPFEAIRVKELGGYTVNLHRPDLENNDTHGSEEPLPADLIDFQLENDGTLVELLAKVDDILNVISETEATRNRNA